MVLPSLLCGAMKMDVPLCLNHLVHYILLVFRWIGRANTRMVGELCPCHPIPGSSSVSGWTLNQPLSGGVVSVVIRSSGSDCLPWLIFQAVRSGRMYWTAALSVT